MIIYFIKWLVDVISTDFRDWLCSKHSIMIKECTFPRSQNWYIESFKSSCFQNKFMLEANCIWTLHLNWLLNQIKSFNYILSLWYLISCCYIYWYCNLCTVCYISINVVFFYLIYLFLLYDKALDLCLRNKI